MVTHGGGAAASNAGGTLTDCFPWTTGSSDVSTTLNPEYSSHSL